MLEELDITTHHFIQGQDVLVHQRTKKDMLLENVYDWDHQQDYLHLQEHRSEWIVVPHVSPNSCNHCCTVEILIFLSFLFLSYDLL